MLFWDQNKKWLRFWELLSSRCLKHNQCWIGCSSLLQADDVACCLAWSIVEDTDSTRFWLSQSQTGIVGMGEIVLDWTPYNVQNQQLPTNVNQSEQMMRGYQQVGSIFSENMKTSLSQGRTNVTVWKIHSPSPTTPKTTQQQHKPKGRKRSGAALSHSLSAHSVLRNIVSVCHQGITHHTSH